MRTFAASSLVLALVLAPLAARAQTSMRGNTHDAQVSLSFEAATPTVVRIVDRASGASARFEVPSGRTPAVRFVADDNVVISWGCGTECENTVLLRPDGTTIAVFDHLEISPDGTFAASFTPGSALRSRHLEIVSMRTGQPLVSRSDVDAWNTCRVTWSAERAFFQRCSSESSSFGIPLSS